MSYWDGIYEFIHVVETGSFTGAAERLHVSKSYISKQIKDLENRLGAQLLARTTRKLTLTDVGEVFYEGCSKMAEQYDQVESMVSNLQDTPRGVLKLGINNTFGVEFMARSLSTFAEAYPTLTLDISTTTHDVDLVGEGIDVALHYGQLEDSTLVARRLGYFSMYVYAAPEYLAANGSPKDISELKNYNCLARRSEVWELNGERENHRVRVKGSWRCDDGFACLEAARHGLGLVQVPSFFVRDDVKSGRLVKVEGDWNRLDRTSWVVYPKNKNLSLKVRLFVDFMVEESEREFKAYYDYIAPEKSKKNK